MYGKCHISSENVILGVLARCGYRFTLDVWRMSESQSFHYRNESGKYFTDVRVGDPIRGASSSNAGFTFEKLEDSKK